MTHRYGLSAMELEALSVILERETGYDSIPTIAQIYDGACCYPGCRFRRSDPADLWKHVHFGKTHHRSFGTTLPRLIAARLSRGNAPAA